MWLLALRYVARFAGSSALESGVQRRLQGFPKERGAGGRPREAGLAW